jgi:hypothetical protein
LFPEVRFAVHHEHASVKTREVASQAIPAVLGHEAPIEYADMTASQPS